jgi:glucuronoarabinoxylan endo-1,4-beta-xylanase
MTENRPNFKIGRTEMYKKLYFLISFVLVLSLAPISNGQGPLYLDFDEPDDVNTQPGFTSFLISDSGATINDITINLSGILQDRRRGGPTGVPYEDIYRDFIFDYGSPTIMLSGLGAGRECEITIYAFDDLSSGFRSAEWTANGAYLFTTEFNGDWPWPADINDYAFSGTGYADIYGNLVLTCTQISGSPYAFVNALIVEPQGEYVPVKHSHDPQPLMGAEDVPVDAVLSWAPGETATAHDVYLGTDFDDVNDANRSSPPGVLVSQGQGGTSYDPYGYLKLRTTYYWRVDEVNEPNICKGAIWSFTTLPYFVMEDFDSYATNVDLRDVWKKCSTKCTRAFVSLDSGIVRSGNSMKYKYRNKIPPRFSQVCADIADLGVEDSDWLGMNANALVLYFRGDANNPMDEQMYVSLTDGDTSPHTGTVFYPSMLDVTIPQWQKWNIPLAQFTGVNLSNVVKITIGFGDGGGSGEGVVYFEDIMLDAEAEQTTTAVGDVNLGEVFQQLLGFGGAAVYDPTHLTGHPKKEEIYDLLFKELGLEILRIRNTYGYSTDPYGVELAATAEIIAEAREPQRSPNLKTELCPWSPPAYLKSNGNESGGGTLAGGPDNFVYDDYAQWWYDSLIEWAAYGVEPDFISLQNEPFIETGYDSCRFFPNEWWDPNVAAYNIAFETVWQKLNAEMGPNMPKMWAPESMGLWDMSFYVDSIIDMNHVDGFAHHLYTEGDYDDPDGMIDALIAADANYGFKPLHMTEYAKLDAIPNFDMGMKFAWHIYNCLYYLHSTSFFNWTLFRGTYSPGGIVTLSVDDYIIRPQYWFLKAYTRFTDKDWSVLGTSVDGPGAENLRMSAFTSPDDTQLTIVILNKSTDRTVLTLPITPSKSEVYRSGQTLKWAYLGSFTPTMSLPPESITTIRMDRHPTANAGPDQKAYAWIDGFAEVTLDGSDSNGLTSDGLTYSWTWTIDSNTYKADGVSPTIKLPVGKHTIKLVVNDGVLDSEPDYVDVKVIAPLKAQLIITPHMINHTSHPQNILAMIEPTQAGRKSDIADEPLILYPPGGGNGIEAVQQYLYGSPAWARGCDWWYPYVCFRVRAFALFNTDELLAAVPDDGMAELQVVGRLESGQYFVGYDTVKIFTPTLKP